MTIDDYVQDCNQMKLYHQLRKGGHSNQGLDKNESEEQTMSSDLIQLCKCHLEICP